MEYEGKETKEWEVSEVCITENRLTEGILTEEELWDKISSLQGTVLYTASGLPFCYEIRIGRNGKPTKELWVDRLKKSKSLVFSSIRSAYQEAIKMRGQLVVRPKALGDIRGISYIYPILWKLELIEVPEKVAQKMMAFSEHQDDTASE